MFLLNEVSGNTPDENGMTALHLACEWGNLKVFKFLINDMKANLHSVDKEGRTPLHVYCETCEPELLIPKLLIREGANVLAKDKSGKNTLQVAKSLWRPDYYLIQFLKVAVKR
jgi:ankyrin repeat protein